MEIFTTAGSTRFTIDANEFEDGIASGIASRVAPLPANATDFMAEVREDLLRGHELNARVQEFFREWHAIDDREAENRHVNPVAFPGLVGRHLDLEQPMDREAVKARMKENVEFMEAVAVAFFHKAAERLPDGDPVADRAINPYAITLDPGRWEADGLFEGQTMTVDEALSKTEGIESLWLDRLPVTA